MPSPMPTIGFGLHCKYANAMRLPQNRTPVKTSKVTSTQALGLNLEMRKPANSDPAHMNRIPMPPTETSSRNIFYSISWLNFNFYWRVSVVN